MCLFKGRDSGLLTTLFRQPLTPLSLVFSWRSASLSQKARQLADFVELARFRRNGLCAQYQWLILFVFFTNSFIILIYIRIYYFEWFVQIDHRFIFEHHSGESNAPFIEG